VSKVTSKLQVTIPKAIADRFSITPGDELEWLPGADSVRVVPVRLRKRAASPAARLALFDAGTERQRQREVQALGGAHVEGRGWTREELYERGGAR
jgi:AbrB family looped-hinge helix DNA binding protein